MKKVAEKLAEFLNMKLRIQKIFLFALKGNHEELQKLAEAGVDINATDHEGWTAAHWAAGDGHLKCLEVLAKYIKKDINAPNQWGCTPVYFAANKGHLKCLKFLAKHTKTDINAPDKEGYTPAHQAAGNDHIKCTEFLIEYKE